MEEGEVPHTKIIQKFKTVATILAEKIKFKRLTKDATIPTRGSSQAAGLDLYSMEQKSVLRGGRTLVGTGLAIGLPQGTYGRIAPRSGLASKAGISIDTGVIDRDYTVEIKVLLVNNRSKEFQIRKGDRIAQIVIERCSLGEAMEVDSLEETERSSNGFGSTDNPFLFNNLRINELSLAGLHPEFKEKISQARQNDPIYQKLLEDKHKKGSNKDGFIYVEMGRTYIPNSEKLKLEIAESEHDSKFAGHFGRHKTLELITQNLFWPKMDEWIRNYIRSCDTCQRNKSSRHAKYGLLQPLDTPYAPWRSILVDFIVGIPESEGRNQIMVVVDRFTKMGNFIPLIGESSAKDYADAFLKNVWKLHGLPDEIISDRDTKWTSKFWKSLCEIMGIKETYPRHSTPRATAKQNS